MEAFASRLNVLPTSYINRLTWNSTSLTTPPTQAFHNPTYSTGYALDYAGNTPAHIVRTGASTTDKQISVSTDYGSSWNPYNGADLYTYPGQVAYSAGADTILLSSTENGTLVSRNAATFSAVLTLPSGAAIASDKRNNSVFYGGSAGRQVYPPRHVFTHTHVAAAFMSRWIPVRLSQGQSL